MQMKYGAPATSDMTGIFVDSHVAGVTYQTPTFTGSTSAIGVFQYKKGETVTFSIGGLVLGSAAGQNVITPLNIVPGALDAKDRRINNICVLLQTLDQDGDLNNGIQISPATAAIVANYTGLINFDQTTTAFAADAKVAELLAALNKAAVFTGANPRPRKLRGATAAREHFQHSISDRKVVNTQYGSVSGYAPDANTWQWLGIPYAQPPIGDLRWKPPRVPVEWKGVRDAIAWGDQAAQYPAYEPFGEGGMSEDCLYLNVTVPRKSSNFPVMVYFHGGAFMVLTNNTKAFNNPASLPTKGVILVTVNHRLGPFGYMAHPLLTKESGYGGSGNYGQMDLIAALTWVKNNIANFGGDPNNVTLFGQSGGGAKALSLMNSPLAKGLFHKVISQSGMYLQSSSFLNGTDLAAAEAKGTALFKDLKVATLAEARAKTWMEIITSVAKIYPPSATGFDVTVDSPNIDGHYMPKSMEESIKNGLPSDVPLLAGSNAADIVVGFDVVRGLVEQMPWRSSNNKAPQYVYKFDHVPVGWAAKGVKAYHGSELVYVFNYPASVFAHYLLGLTGLPPDGYYDPPANTRPYWTPVGYATYPTGYDTTDKQLTDKVMAMWTNFAKTGDPSITGFKWTLYTMANDTYLEIENILQLKTGLASAFPR
jgi:para-nitrobenzyl esterase